MSRVELLTWHVIAVATAKTNGNIGLAFLHQEKVNELLW
jgi:hypothetical protein